MGSKGTGALRTHQHFAESIRPGEVDVYDIWVGPEACETRSRVDTVVMSILCAPNDDLFHAASSELAHVARIGDAAAPRDVTAVIYEGEALGRRL